MARRKRQGTRGASAAISTEADVRIVRCDTGAVERTWALEGRAGAACLAFSPRREVLAAGWRDRVLTWDLSSGVLRSSRQGHEGMVLSLAFDRTGARLASGSIDRTVLIWSVAR